MNTAVKRTESLRKLQLWGAFYVFANATIITSLAFLAEGKGSAYYAGLNLCAISVGSFIPWSTVVLMFNMALDLLPVLRAIFSYMEQARPLTFHRELIFHGRHRADHAGRAALQREISHGGAGEPGGAR